MVYSWNTSKQADGSFAWRVYGVEYAQPTITLRTGNARTRAIAVRQAKQATMPYRRGDVMPPVYDTRASELWD